MEVEMEMEMELKLGEFLYMRTLRSRVWKREGKEVVVVVVVVEKRPVFVSEKT